MGLANLVLFFLISLVQLHLCENRPIFKNCWFSCRCDHIEIKSCIYQMHQRYHGFLHIISSRKELSIGHFKIALFSAKHQDLLSPAYFLPPKSVLESHSFYLLEHFPTGEGMYPGPFFSLVGAIPNIFLIIFLSFFVHYKFLFSRIK